MEKQLLIRLQGLLNHETSGTVNSILANYLLDHYREFAQIGIRELAARCHVSTASVSRFARNLGYQDFFDMKDDLYQLAEHEHNGLEIFDGYENMTSAHFLADAKEHMRSGIDAVPDYKLKKLAEDIFAYQQVVLMGHWHSGDVALQMQHDLCYLDKITQIFVRPDEQLDFFHKMPPKTLVIVFSCKGKFFADFFPGHKVPPRSAGSSIYLLTANAEQQEDMGKVIHLDCNAGNSLSGSNLALFFLEKRILFHCYQQCYPNGHHE